MQSSKGKNASTRLLQKILASDYMGLSGIMSFKNGKLAQLPSFQIINVIGKSYREIALWSPKFGLVGDLGSIYWRAGGEKMFQKDGV